MWTDLWLRCEGGHQNKFTTSSSNMRMRQLVFTKAYSAGVDAKNFFCPQIIQPLLSCPQELLSLPSRLGYCLQVWLRASLWLVVLILSVTPVAHAQNFLNEPASRTDNTGESALDARIQILTRPIGALVALEGEYSMVGRTPYTITHFLRGIYRIRASKTGFENWSTEYAFNGRGDDKLTIKLKPKTRVKSVIRSALIPGWGQVYADQRNKGLFISLLQFSAAGVLVYQDSRYSAALNDYRAALQNLRATQSSQDEQQDLIAQVKSTKADLDNAYTQRRRWMIITGSIYLYNLIDAALFFPSYRHGDLDVSLTLEPLPGASGAALGLNVNKKF